MARRHRSSLTVLQAGRLRTLPVLMEDDSNTPPVPLMDSSYAPGVSSDHSASKRKRGDRSASPPDDGEFDIRTPKRSRSRMRNTDENATPAQQHSVRRKQGIRNLSNLNLRHASESQSLPQSPRESKFQEGSLTDKPSEAPPSVYTRVTRTESGDLVLMDELMADYHNDGQNVPVSGDHEGNNGVHVTSADADAMGSAEAQNTGFLRFGRSLATSFHPVTLWNRIWNEQKEELTRQHALEAEQRARLKANAEAKYAEMKKSGQFSFQTLKPMVASEEATSTPYDSAVSLESAARSGDHRRISSLDSNLSGGRIGGGDDTEVPDTASKALRSIRSRLYLKRPSLSNLRLDLKRVRSDVNISGSVQRESSSSASPVKADFEDSGLRRSHSKYDLKKQHKLSKRVSDLELKLQKARRELEEALADASPAPRVSGKYERFTPTPTLKRPRFVPGRLPTLPSERLLFPELVDSAASDAQAMIDDRAENESEDGDNVETIKASRAKHYPARASTLFEPESRPEQHTIITTTTTDSNSIPKKQGSSTNLDLLRSDAATMDLNDSNANESAVSAAKKPEYSELDMKLKALDQSYKASRKSTTSKKRKSGGNLDDTAFKLDRGDDDDDDAEWEEANQTPKKRRKSGPNKSKPVQESTEDSGRTVTKAAKAKRSKKADEQPQTQTSESPTHAETESGSEEGTGRSSQFRNSLDLQGHQLEPLYEEEEEVVTVPLKDEPSKPTAKATPARYGRSRPMSPHPPSVEAGSEEVLMTRAAGAAQKGRQTRASSPPPGKHSSVMEVIDEVVTIVPGDKDVPALPRVPSREPEGHNDSQGGDPVKKATNGKRMTRKESFQWPDDVF